MIKKSSTTQTLKYKVIKDEDQLAAYSKIRTQLLKRRRPTESDVDEIELLSRLISAYEERPKPIRQTDPIQLLSALMFGDGMDTKGLARLLNVKPGEASRVLGYKKPILTEYVEIPSNHFNISADVFNRPYPLRVRVASHRIGKGKKMMVSATVKKKSIKGSRESLFRK